MFYFILFYSKASMKTFLIPFFYIEIDYNLWYTLPVLRWNYPSKEKVINFSKRVDKPQKIHIKWRVDVIRSFSANKGTDIFVKVTL